MLESLYHHASPEQREEDFEAAARLMKPYGYAPAPRAGYFADFDGRRYSYHFWAYPLACVPAKAALRLVRGDEFAAFHVTNVALLALALLAAARARALSPGRRAIFVALAGVAPVLWYVRWPHPEIFSWAFVVLALVQLEARRYARASLFFAVGAVQNPPIAFLAWATVALSIRARRPLVTLAAACASLLALAPAACYYAHFRVPNLIAAAGLADPHLVGAHRVVGFFFDLDQGMLVHAPATVALGLVGLAFAVRKRAGAGVFVAFVLVAMAAASTSAVNWNAGSSGMLRYGVWALPVFAWLAASV
jgi:hypothetical protein